MYNKKALLDIAVYAIPSFFLLILILVAFSFYFIQVSKDTPSLYSSKSDDQILTTITYLRTPVNQEETISDLIRQSLDKNDFTELDEKTNELLKETKIPLSIYDGNNNLMHEIIPSTQSSNTIVRIPYNNEIIKVGYIRTKDLSEQDTEEIDCDSLSKQECIDSKKCVYIYYGPGYDPITGITTTLDVWHCIECKPANCPSAPQKYCPAFNNKCNANCEWTGPPTLTQTRGCQPK